MKSDLSVNAEYLETIDPFSVELRDTSLISTTLSGLELCKRAGLVIAHDLTGYPDPAYEAGDAYQPQRAVELSPDHSWIVTTDFGTDHRVDIYNRESLGVKSAKLPPVVMTMELALPSTKGIKAPVIEALSELCHKQDRSLLVISSEGFEGRKVSPLKLRKLNFDVMTQNILDCIDCIEVAERVRIPEIEVTGGSRGGTLSLLLATKEISKIRASEGKPEHRVVGVGAFAPAGLDRSTGLYAAKQFTLDEPMHMIRKASDMAPETLKSYSSALLDSLPPKQALGAVAVTTALFLTSTPLRNIGERLHGDVPTTVVVLEGDRITSPRRWSDALACHPDSVVIAFPGSHLSIDSLRRVYGIEAWHLSGRDPKKLPSAA